MFKTKPLIEQHFHGAYGVDFNNAGVDEILFLANKLNKIGIAGFFPTLVTDTIINTKRQIEVIKEASKKCSSILEDAEKRITILINENDNLREENFIPEE